jgi:hypothetical protein
MAAPSRSPPPETTANSSSSIAGISIPPSQQLCGSYTARRIDCGAVNYLDYNTERIEEQRGHLVFMSKRKSFEHEREVRLIFWSVDDVSSYNTRKNHEPPPGYPIDCDLGELIQSVYVSPASQDWYLGLVRRMCASFGVGADVKRSDLANSPFH